MLAILLFPLLLSDLPPILLCPFFSIIFDSTFITIYPFLKPPLTWSLTWFLTYMENTIKYTIIQVNVAFTFEREHIILVFLSLNFLTPNVPPSSIHLPISQLHFNWQLWDTTFCECATIHSSADGHIGYVHFLWRQRNSVSVLRYRILWEILSRVVYLPFLHFIRILRSQPSSSCLEVGRVTAWTYALLSNTFLWQEELSAL